MNIDVICVTCDAFGWMIPTWLDFWRRAVPGTVLEDSQVTVVTNRKPLGVSGVNVVHLGVDRGWSNNMIKFLQDYDNDKPFLLMLDDYIMEPGGVDDGLLEDCYNVIDLHDHVGYLRLVPMPPPTLRWHNHRGNNRDIGRLDKSTHTSYCCSLQAAFWRRDVMFALLYPNRNPWKTEGRGSRDVARMESMRNIDFLSTRKWALRYKNALRRGKLRQDVAKWIRMNGGKVNAQTTKR